jgi:hypothetical protein
MTTCSRGGVFYNFLVGLGLEYCANAKMDALIADDSPRSSRSPEMQKQRKALGFSNSGFCYNFEALGTIENGLEPGSSQRQDVQAMIDFWLHESTRYKYNQALPKNITEGLGTSDAFDVRFKPLLDAFGPDRLLFGSNWPVSPDYEGMVNLFAQQLSSNPGLMNRILVTNPVRAYRLGSEEK